MADENSSQAANLLKRTEGLVKLVVSNPGKRPATPVAPEIEKKNTTAATNKSGLQPKGPPSRPHTPAPEHVDFLTCPIIPNKETPIDILTDDNTLGINFVGGKDTLLPGGIVVIEIYVSGAAHKDGRVQPGDQILEANGVSLKDATSKTASQALRQQLPKVKLVILRPEKLEYQTVDIEFARKPGKGIGISLKAHNSGKGVYISDILPGSPADIDGRVMIGDMLVSVNGQNVENDSHENIAVLLKTSVGRVFLKLRRYRLTPR